MEEEDEGPFVLVSLAAKLFSPSLVFGCATTQKREATKRRNLELLRAKLNTATAAPNSLVHFVCVLDRCRRCHRRHRFQLLIS